MTGRSSGCWGVRTQGTIRTSGRSRHPPNAVTGIWCTERSTIGWEHVSALVIGWARWVTPTGRVGAGWPGSRGSAASPRCRSCSTTRGGSAPRRGRSCRSAHYRARPSTPTPGCTCSSRSPASCCTCRSRRRCWDGRRQPSARYYLRKRVFRIFPVYWAILALCGLGLGSAYVGWDGDAQVVGRMTDPGLFVRAALLLQDYAPQTLFTGIGPAWSLCVEVVFYLAVPLLGLLWPRASRLTGRHPARARRRRWRRWRCCSRSAFPASWPPGGSGAGRPRRDGRPPGTPSSNAASGGRPTCSHSGCCWPSPGFAFRTAPCGWRGDGRAARLFSRPSCSCRACGRLATASSPICHRTRWSRSRRAAAGRRRAASRGHARARARAEHSTRGLCTSSGSSPTACSCGTCR